ncbi:MAG: retropepsin-like aspartic protease [Xanthobacteraceae bacterium]
MPKEEQIATARVVPNPSFRTKVPLKVVGGTFVVPVEINGAISLNFVIDSGAADVSVPADVVGTLIRTGTLERSDFIGTQIYILADGSKSPSDTFIIRSLKVGDKVVESVKGSVAPATGTLLLGQSFLQHFKSWSIDNTKHELLLEPR